MQLTLVCAAAWATGLARTSRVTRAHVSLTNTGAQVSESSLEDWGIRPAVLATDDEFATRATLLNADPPVFAIDNFLSPEECDEVIRLAIAQRAEGAQEADLYLNYRVNQEVASGASSEASALIEEQQLSEEDISASAPSGFRVQMTSLCEAMERDGAGVGDSSVSAVLGDRVLRLLGQPNRKLRFAEGCWIRPDRRYIVVRDVTTVHYEPGEGVAPHVDGKDATVLIYLTDIPEGMGGRTVFPEDGFASTPVRGRALIYNSRTELLHYSEALKQGAPDKWVMQLLLDFKHTDTGTGPYVDFATGQVIQGI